MKIKNMILPAVGGLFVGVINGMLGAGGGMLAVPLLKKAGLTTKKAHANSIAVILPLSVFSSVLYLAAGRVNLSDTYAYMPAGIVGALAGSWLLRKISDKWLRRIFGVFMIWAGVRLLLK